MKIALFVPNWPPGLTPNGIVTYASQLVPALRRLPGHGETLLFCKIWYQIVFNDNLIALVASFETEAKPHLRTHLRRFYTDSLFASAGKTAAKLLDCTPSLRRRGTAPASCEEV